MLASGDGTGIARNSAKNGSLSGGEGEQSRDLVGHDNFPRMLWCPFAAGDSGALRGVVACCRTLVRRAALEGVMEQLAIVGAAGSDLNNKERAVQLETANFAPVVRWVVVWGVEV